MSIGQQLWLRILLPLVVIGVIALSLQAWHVPPKSHLVSRTWASTTASLASPSPKPCASWRLHVLLDSDATPPGPDWILHEGRQPGEGYELHWLPQRLGLQIYRTGEQPMLLGAVNLRKAADEIVFIRRGARLRLVVDGQTRLDLVDAAATKPPSVWGFQAAASVGNAMISLYDDSLLNEGDDPESDSLRRLGDAAALDPVKQRVELVDAVKEAELALRALGPHHDDYAKLRAWMAWIQMRSAIDDASAEAGERAQQAFKALLEEATRQPCTSELPGLVLNLLPRLAAKACNRPPGPSAPQEVLSQRHRWLGLLGEAGALASRLCGDQTSDGCRWQLQLLLHATDCLNGKTPQPTPAAGPPWLTARWRAFASRNPKISEFPPLPSEWNERNPVTPALTRLCDFANFDPLPAVVMASPVREAIELGDRVEIAAALTEGPPREAVLCRAILALRGIGDAKQALDELTAGRNQQQPLCERDPLAFALQHLLQYRKASPRASGGDPAAIATSGERPVAIAIPSALAPFERLLGGRIDEAWMPDAAVLPPAQALATALAMQEVSGGAPNWSLLEQFHCFTLPLALMAPAAASAPNPDTTQPAPNPDPEQPVIP